LISGPNAFWNDTLLGKMIPFSPVMYINPVDEKTYDHYEENTVAVYVKNQKFSSNEDSPLELVYASPSFDRTDDGEISAVLIYKVNKDYKPSFEYDILN